MLAIKSINGVEPAIQPLTDGYTVAKSDLLADGSGRSTESGKAIRYPIRLGTYKLTLKFKGETEKITSVDSLVSAFTQDVVFLDGGTYVTAKMYSSDRTFTNRGLISELAVNLIEI
jgi:hypothetical protein